MTSIYHLTEPDTWEAAVAAGEYRQSTRGVSLERQGFIHCSRLHQVRPVGECIYADAADLVLLEIDPAKVPAEVRFEPGEPGATEEFPHVYGPIPVEAVVNVAPVPRDDAGRLVFPE
jgi:uncharacterized protein (DUF952 family)